MNQPKKEFVWKEKQDPYVTVTLLLVSLGGYFLLSRMTGLPERWYESSRGMVIAGLIVAIDLLIGMRYDARIFAAREARRRDQLAKWGATYRVRRKNDFQDPIYRVEWRYVGNTVKLIRLDNEEEVIGAGLVGELVESSQPQDSEGTP